jgi:hypothetical protein
MTVTSRTDINNYRCARSIQQLRVRGIEPKMAPLAPKALEAIRAEFQQVKTHNPLLGNLVKLRGIPRLLGLNDGGCFVLRSPVFRAEVAEPAIAL